jgi:hypothetical protein
VKDHALAGITEDQVLSMLPPSLQKLASASNEELDAIGAVLAAGPSNGISLKGGAPWVGNIWILVKQELHSFLCTDSKAYADLRKQWKSHREKSSSYAIGTLSAVVATQLGLAAGVVTPLVVWAILFALRVGKNVACQAWVLPVATQTPVTRPPKEQ